MKQFFILLIFLTACRQESSQTEEGKKNWAFVECMNTKKVINKCKKIKDFNEKVECMSTACGRSNSRWTSVEFK